MHDRSGLFQNEQIRFLYRHGHSPLLTLANSPLAMLVSEEHIVRYTAEQENTSENISIK